ncbi:MAG: DUF3575 domain-containing protein [Gammaproteobacteria bacterium]|nr:DUF3575 domain-containing protein [Gammaproteobacteria bacterium]
MKTKTIVLAAIVFFCSFLSLSVQAFEVKNRLSLRINPIGLVGAVFSGDVMLKVWPQVAVGPVFAYQDFDFSGASSKLLGTGMRIEWYFDEALQNGGYVGLLSTYAQTENSITEQAKRYSRAGRDLRIVGMIGYLWRWDNVTFNLGIGGGYTSFGNPDLIADDGAVFDMPIKFPDSHVAVNMDISLGWVF